MPFLSVVILTLVPAINTLRELTIRRTVYIRRDGPTLGWVVVISAENHKRQRRKRQSVTAKREKSQTSKVLTAILTLTNLA